MTFDQIIAERLAPGCKACRCTLTRENLPTCGIASGLCADCEDFGFEGNLGISHVVAFVELCWGSACE